MRALASHAAVAFAIANLYLLYLTGPLISPGHQLVFHLPGSATVLFIPVLLDLAALTGLLCLLLVWAGSHPRAQLLLWALLLLPIPAVLIATTASFTGHPAKPWLLGGVSLLAVVGLCLTAARLSALSPWFRRHEPLLRAVLGFVSLSGLLILGQLLWNAWQTRHLNPPFVSRVSRVSQTTQTPSPRVVWVILDELSFRQIFSNRQPGLSLPNLDRLSSQATVLTGAQAAADFTRIAVPSLLTGIPLSATKPAADGQHLLLHPRGAHRWGTLNPSDTVFGDATRAGLPTGIAGWYEPYCRLLPTVVDRCFWTYHDDLPAGLLADATIAQNALAPLRDLRQGVLHLAGAAPASADEAVRLDLARHTADYRDLYAAGDRLLHAQNAGLLLLHMPIPHPWGFFDRRTGTFPAHRTSYLDNLVLADLYVGHLRSLMEADGSWDRTDLILMGDHGWRAGAVWRPSGFWTPEEEKASHGGTLQDRPAVLIKLSGQVTPARIDAPFAASRTRSLMDALLGARLHTAAELGRWIGQSTPQTMH